MFKITILVAFVAICNAQHGHKSGESYANSNLGHDGGHGDLGGYLGGHGYEEKEIDYKAYPKYEFKYGVADAHTGDNKQQHESRDGDVVKGEYSLHESDGTIRTVKYTADHKNGFNAHVTRSGHAAHPETYIKSAFIATGHKGHESYGSY